MEPNATIPMTPRTTTTVPCESEKLSECECERGRGTYPDVVFGDWGAYEEAGEQEVEDK
jgi:hypothetical protein